MISLQFDTPILLATKPADFRCGIDGFAALCKYQLKQDPRSGTLFVFINRKKNMIRVLTYQSNGFWLMTKRLSKGKFQHWPTPKNPLTSIEAVKLRQILAAELSLK